MPPARPRTRDGLHRLSWSKAPQATEFWPDKLRIEVRGHIHWGDDGSFMGYLATINPNICFAAAPTIGRKFRAAVSYGPSLTGDLKITMTSQGRADQVGEGHAKITLALNLNPTTARALAVRRNTVALDQLPLGLFFKPQASLAEAFGEGAFADRGEIALDRADNVLLSVLELGGLTASERADVRSSFLATYEQKLRQLVEGMLHPKAGAGPDEQDICRYVVVLDWGALVLRQAEIYVERSCDEPVGIVRRLYDRGLDLARRIKAQEFWDVPSDGRPVPTTFAVSQDDGYPHIVVPLTGSRNVELSVYAKTNRRVRLEVRYRSAFGRHLRGCSTAEDRLSSLVLRLTENAAERMPWTPLARASAVLPSVDVADVPKLIAHLIAATSNKPNLFQPLVHQIMMTGGVLDDDVRHPGISKAIARLVRAEVLWRWEMQLKEQKTSRRYGLTDRYAATRLKMLSGFVPSLEWVTPDAVLDDDHYEETARLMGGRQWVERPLE